LVEGPGTIGVEVFGNTVDLQGPLAVGATLSEALLLEYVNGFQGRQLGWGRLTKEKLNRALELHAVYADLMRRTEYVARAHGSNLLAHVLRSLEQAATGREVAGALGGPGDAVLLLSGHDANLSNVSGMLHLSWKLPGYQADETPPGGALIFSLWRDTRTGALSVRVRYLAQTLDQMRNSVPLTLAHPPASREVRIPGCGRNCSWADFRKLAERAIDPAFVSVPPR
jgi:4-phytase/acid phosphatase